MIEHRFGDKLVKIEGPHAEHIMEHFRNISHEAGRELLHDAHNKGHSHLDYQVHDQWHHTQITHNSDGTYSIKT